MTIVTRISTYLIVLALVIAVTAFMLPHRDFTPRGLLLPSNKNFTPVNFSTVTLTPNNATNSGAIVGYINIEAYAKTIDNTTIAGVETYARLLAANAGANRVVVNQFGQSDNMVILHAQAIRTGI